MSAFHVFDVHNKGYIESRDLREALGLTVTEIPSKELQQILKRSVYLMTERYVLQVMLLEELFTHIQELFMT